MGITTRKTDLGHEIQDFWPDETKNELFINGESSFSDIQEEIKDKWPGKSFKDIRIEPVRIQTACLGYDLYDPLDYTCFLKLSIR
mgnify:CR=1 FL=1